MPESDCWSIRFDRMIKEHEREAIADRIVNARPPGCYIVYHSFYNSPIVELISEGKTGAHQKRRAAKRNPGSEWVKDSIFIVRGEQR